MWIFSNLLYKIVALLVAVILWSAAQGIKSIERTLDVPVALENLAEDFVVALDPWLSEPLPGSLP